MKRRATTVSDWLGRPANRATIIVVALIIGLLAAGLVYFARVEANHAADARAELRQRDRELADAIRRIGRLETPTRANVRRLVERYLRRLERGRAPRGATQPQTGRLLPGGGGAPPATNPQPPPPASPVPQGEADQPQGQPDTPAEPPPSEPAGPLDPLLPLLPDLPQLPSAPQLRP